MFALMGLLVLGSAIALDYAYTSHSLAVRDLKAHSAGRWSVGGYIMAAPGFIFAVKISLWLMIPEAIGLYIGSYLAVKRRISSLQKQNGLDNLIE